MPKTVEILTAVAEGKQGFRFGDPVRVSESSLAVVLPICRTSKEDRKYKVLPEVPEVIINDSGVINKVNLKNTSKSHVFVRSGTVFRGKTQERATTRSVVVPAGGELGIDARCVHQSKGIQMGAKFEAKGFTSHTMDQKLYSSGYQKPADQSVYWNTVADFTSEVRCMTSSMQDGAPVAQSASQRRRMKEQGAPTPMWMGVPIAANTAGHDDLASTLDAGSGSF